jgi:nifR3 family TIM-barrel protein
MDGVTDAVFRQITDEIAAPDVMFTEFVAVEAVKVGAVRALDACVVHAPRRSPIICQIYGTDLEGFYQSALMICALGFDGVDINMGCPAQAVAARGAGAGLIRNPLLARRIIKVVKQAVVDWCSGVDVTKYLHPQVSNWIKYHKLPIKRRLIPVSVKTRIGYETPVVNAWIGTILESHPDCITVHGRTLKQLYSGKADWEAIAQAVQLIHCSGHTKILGNGDVTSYKEAVEKAKTYGVDGVLIGRAARGNPWVFTGKLPTLQERLSVALRHAKLYQEIFPHSHFLAMRKHLAWYCVGFPGAAEARVRALQVKNVAEVEGLVAECLRSFKWV